MNLTDMSKTRASRVMGIDCSTHSMAFCIYYNRKPIKWGKILFEGSDVFKRMASAERRIGAIANDFNVDYIVFESAILAKIANADTTIKLAMVYGICIAKLMKTGTKVITTKPLEWQSFIGNPNFKAAEKLAVKKEFPGYSTTWYSNKIRAMRKQKTMDFFNSRFPKMKLDDDDVSDSCGLAYYGYYHLTRRH